MARKREDTDGWVSDRDPNGTGPMKRRKHVAKWYGYWIVYEIDADGIERRRKKTKVIGPKEEFGTKKDAERVLRDWLAEQRGTPQQGTTPTFEERGKHYLKVKAGTWEGYGTYGGIASILETHVYPVIGQRPINEIVHSELQLLLNNVRIKGEDPSHSLLKKIRTQLGAIFGLCVCDGLLVGNPAYRLALPSKRKDVDETFCTVPQIHALLLTAEKHGTRRDVVFLKLMFSKGLRSGEQVALRLNDIDKEDLHLDEMYVRIRNPRKKNADTNNTPAKKLPATKNRLKTIGSKKPVPLEPELRDELLAYAHEEGITNPLEFLFQSEVGTPLDPDNYLDRVIKPLAKTAGLIMPTEEEIKAKTYPKPKVPSECLNHIDFRAVRRSCATHHADKQRKELLKNTQALLRHSNPETAHRHYVKTVMWTEREASRQWFEVVNEYKRLLDHDAAA